VQSTIISVLIALMIILFSVNIIAPMKNVNAWHASNRDPFIPEGNLSVDGKYDFFIANGFRGDLVILENNGIITGSVFGDSIIGFWDNVAHKIIFTRLGGSGQVYVGYSFQRVELDPQRGTFCYSTLSGEFLTPGAGGGTPQRFEYGWYAWVNIPCD
jgi:hypothetical protein